MMALVGERMEAGAGGTIINISSTASLNPSPTSEPYGAAKSGLNALTRSYAFAYGPKVRVNGIAAGPFLTDISKAWDMQAFEQRAKTTLHWVVVANQKKLLALRCIWPATLRVLPQARSFALTAVRRRSIVYRSFWAHMARTTCVAKSRSYKAVSVAKPPGLARLTSIK